MCITLTQTGEVMDKKNEQDLNEAYPNGEFIENVTLGQFTEELLKLNEAQRAELINYAKKMLDES